MFGSSPLISVCFCAGPTDAESAGANQAESAVVGKPNSRRPAKYLRQKAADLESDDSAEEEDTSSPVFRGASSAPVENIWKAASKAQKPSAKNTKKRTHLILQTPHSASLHPFRSACPDGHQCIKIKCIGLGSQENQRDESRRKATQVCTLSKVCPPANV
jgi:hypothetical protein